MCGPDGLFVPTAAASAGLFPGQAVDITGDQAAGYTIGARISSDPENALVLGSDGGLFVQGPRYAYGTLTPRTVSRDITDNWATPTIGAQTGGFSVATVAGVPRLVLPDGGMWFIQVQLRFDTSAGFSAPSGGLLYGGISGFSRGFMTAVSIVRPTTVAGMHCTQMDDFADAAQPSVGFRGQANATHLEDPEMTGWWSVSRMGPSVV